MKSNIVLLIAVLFVTACGAAKQSEQARHLNEPAIVKPISDEEQALLDAAGTMNEGQSKKVGRVTIAVERAYLAASGRQCKLLSIAQQDSTKKQSERIICLIDDKWVFTPSVFPEIK